ncbi:hypothetical protein [Streptomyces fulvoviolaceus]|uniref:hypothetical protein n=1 Tax=Streptomyces fulvoviolaceus TaxID=285535 RepID=UPI0004C9DEF8|nr:hypothetical protein [Streptomyces fulvoviolaceus]
MKSIDFTVGIEYEDLGQHGDDLANASDLKPGQFVHGTIVLSVPSTQPGRLEFSDREDIPFQTCAWMASRVMV